MHVDWAVFGRGECGMRLVTLLAGPEGFSSPPTWAIGAEVSFTGRLNPAVRGEQLPDDIPWTEKPPGNYRFGVGVGFY